VAASGGSKKGDEMQTPNVRQERKRKPYETPTATKLTPEQAKPKLFGLAMTDDEPDKEGAMELLELMVRKAPSKDSTNVKKAS
jgi:hypothetical protein